MPTNPAKPLIVFFGFPGMKLLDLSGPLQVFADAGYRTVVISMTGGPVMTDTSLSVSAAPASSVHRKQIDTLIVVGGKGCHDAAQDSATRRTIERLANKARRTASICTGAFLLAAAGLLEGRRAVTHWDSCERLAQEFPSIDVQEDSIYVQDGTFWTSAGVTAGIDLSLQLVREDFGNSEAMRLAQNLLTFVVRPGGQSQFSRMLNQQTSDTAGRFNDLHHWVIDNLDQDLRVEVLAERMHMSMRTFARTYVQHTGQTPAKAVESFRIEAARTLLISTDKPILTIANDCGFANDEGFRRAFLRAFHVAPSEYRQRFYKAP